MKRQPSRGFSSRGFTLLELVLAIVLGAMVVLVTLGIFVQIDQTDTILAKRAQQAGDLERLRLIAQRTTSNFVMSNEPQPAKDAGDDADGVSRVGRARNLRDPNQPLPAPRLVLEADHRGGGAVLTSSGRGGENRDSIAVQRLEVVVSDSPVPQESNDPFARALGTQVRDGIATGRAAAAGALRGDVSGERKKAADRAKSATGSGSGAASDNSGAGASSVQNKSIPTTTGKGSAGGAGSGGAVDPNNDNRQPDPLINSAEGDQTPVRAVRGAIELHPQPLTGREMRAAQVSGDEPVLAWEAWWVPLPPRQSATSTAPTDEDIAAFGEPFKIASNIRYMKWKLFDDRVWKTELSATWEQQLPAHIVLEVETTAGLTANWMFEVDWGRGPEIPPAPIDLGPKRAEAVDSSGGATQATSGSGVRPPSGGGITSKTSRSGGKTPTPVAPGGGKGAGRTGGKP